jgi:hypothetical protein
MDFCHQLATYDVRSAYFIFQQHFNFICAWALKCLISVRKSNALPPILSYESSSVHVKKCDHCWFVYLLFYVQLKSFHLSLYGDVINTAEELQYISLRPVFRAFEKGEIFIVHTCFDMGPEFFCGIILWTASVTS